MKTLINLRGACGSGKTESVRQWCRKNGFHVEYVEVSNGQLPISVTDRAIVIGDYEKTANCTGTDALRCGGKACGKQDLCELIREICKKYNPDYIIYEHMLSSQICQYTMDVAKAAEDFGYTYMGIQLWTDDDTRLRNLHNRSGTKAKTKNFIQNGKNVNRATELLRAKGYNIVKVCTTEIEKENMWRIVENAVQKA